MTSRDGFTIVWDWNGTLCDDRTILLDAVGQTLVNEGFEPLSQQQLIQRFARPLRTFFENACGRDLLTSEWERVQSTFRRIYRSREAEVTLVEDAYDVLAQGNRSAAGQFLLSLAPHDELMHFVQKYGIAKWFNGIRGRTRPDQEKPMMLAELIMQRSLNPLAWCTSAIRLRTPLLPARSEPFPSWSPELHCSHPTESCSNSCSPSLRVR